MEDREKEEKIMGFKTVFKKGTAKQMKRNVTSPRLAHKLSRAIEQLEQDDLDRLVRIGKVKRIRKEGDYEICVYRVTPSKRIVFSPVNGKNYIHDVVSTTNPRQVRSLTPVKDGVPVYTLNEGTPIHSVKDIIPAVSTKKITNR